MKIIRDDELTIFRFRKKPEISFSWAWDGPEEGHLWLGIVLFPFHLMLDSLRGLFSIVRHDRLRLEPLSEMGEEVARVIRSQCMRQPPTDSEKKELFGLD